MKQGYIIVALVAAVLIYIVFFHPFSCTHGLTPSGALTVESYCHTLFEDIVGGYAVP